MKNGKRVGKPRQKNKQSNSKKTIRNETFASNLKQTRINRGITQATLAGWLGVETSTVSAWEQGTNFPSIEMLLLIPDVLDCDLDYLIGRLPEQKHDVQLVKDMTGLSTKTINLLIKSKKLSEWSKDPENQKETQGLIFTYPKYLYYERLSLGEMISKIIENKYSNEMVDNLENLIFTDRFYAYWLRNAREEFNPNKRMLEPMVNFGFDVVTEDSYFSSLQYKTSMIFSKILDDITNKRNSFTLEEIKKLLDINDDEEAREILMYQEKSRQRRKRMSKKSERSEDHADT